jgi:Amidohydrolase family
VSTAAADELVVAGSTGLHFLRARAIVTWDLAALHRILPFEALGGRAALASFQELMLPRPALPIGRHCMKSSHLLVRAGLTPLQALQSGTSVPAAAFHLPDRGLIRDGMRADLVLRPNHRDSRYADHHRSLEARHSLSETSARVVGNFVQCWRQIESPLMER